MIEKKSTQQLCLLGRLEQYHMKGGHNHYFMSYGYYCKDKNDI